MNHTIRQLLDQIHALEDELRTTLHEQESRLSYQIHGKRVEFERTIRDAHTRLKVGFIKWIIADRPQNLLCAPLIYGMIIPLAFFNLCITLYQAICFPIFQITKARRSDCLVFDRHKLEYLNGVEKFHCAYCEYANGLAAYATEIISLTEQSNPARAQGARFPRALHALSWLWRGGRLSWQAGGVPQCA